MYPSGLQLYKIPPTSSISLAEFEELAQERLKVLRTIDNVKLRGLNKYSEEWKRALMAELKKLGLKCFAKLINGSGCGQTESELQMRKRDHISHFILRLAYCRSEELRRWFLSREEDLFRTRFTSLSAEDIQRFMQINISAFMRPSSSSSSVSYLFKM
jgi:DNA primase large subunit